MKTLDDTINKASFWSAIVLILAGVLSMFFHSMPRKVHSRIA